MKLSQINKERLEDEEIQEIVFSNIEDSGKNTKYAICFGNSMLLKERVTTAIDSYKKGRIEKIIFTGGSNGISNQTSDTIPEAVKMKNLAIKLGIKEQDIMIEDKSKNSFENIENSMGMLNENIDSIAIITSEFHLKRCKAIIGKRYPNIETILIKSNDGFTDRDNWYLSDGSWNSGRSIVTYEANLLIKYAKENKIEDLEIASIPINKMIKK